MPFWTSTSCRIGKRCWNSETSSSVVEFPPSNHYTPWLHCTYKQSLSLMWSEWRSFICSSGNMYDVIEDDLTNLEKIASLDNFFRWCRGREVVFSRHERRVNVGIVPISFKIWTLLNFDSLVVQGMTAKLRPCLHFRACGWGCVTVRWKALSRIGCEDSLLSSHGWQFWVCITFCKVRQWSCRQTRLLL